MFSTYKSNTDKILKINITINLTNTNEKIKESEILELIVPEEKLLKKEELEFNVRNRLASSFSGTGSVQNMLENFNKIIDAHNYDKDKTRVNQLNITVHSPNDKYQKTDSNIVLKEAQKIILSQRQVIEEMDSKIEKTLYTKILGRS